MNRIFSWNGGEMEKKNESLLLGVLKIYCSCTSKRIVMTTFTAEDTQVTLHCKICDNLWNVAVCVEKGDMQDIEEDMNED